jgi:hypothetical protein
VSDGNSLALSFNCSDGADTGDFSITFVDSTEQTATSDVITHTYPNHPPSVPVITAPVGGRNYTDLQAQNLTVGWNNATDVDGDSISYELQYSNDSGSMWSALGANESPYYWNASFLGFSQTIQMRIRANDPYNVTDWNSTGDFAIQFANVFGNGSSINSTITNLTATVNGETNVSNKSFEGVLEVAVTSGDQTILSFDYNFSNGFLIDFADVDIANGSEDGRAYLSISGFDSTGIVGGKTATMYGIDTDYNRVCVKDEEGAEATSISQYCSGNGERSVICDGEGHSGYMCTIEGTTLTISGLRHSALIQYTPRQSSSSPSSGSGGIPVYNQPVSNATLPPVQPPVENATLPIENITTPAKNDTIPVVKPVKNESKLPPIVLEIPEGAMPAFEIGAYLVPFCGIAIVIAAVAAYVLFFRKERAFRLK